MSAESNYASALALVSLGGFALQQGLQIVDPLVTIVSRLLPGNLDETAKKRFSMGLLSLAFGLIISFIGNIKVFSLIGVSISGPMDVLLSALVLSAGTEGANSFQKYVNYVKEARKPQQIELTIVPASLSLSTGQAAKLMCAVTTDGDPSVEWMLVQPAMGQISSDGQFTAGPTKGPCTVVAKSRSNPGKLSYATITII